MRGAQHIVFGLLLGLVLAIFAASATGCSFVFDFTECEADGDCQSFEEPEAGEFFVCSADNKCVFEPERECRSDDHCGGGQACEEGVCTE